MILSELDDSRSIILTSVVRLPYYKADFGRGRPVWSSVLLSPVWSCVLPLSLPNGVVSSSTGDGVEAWVVTVEEVMNKLNKTITSWLMLP